MAKRRSTSKTKTEAATTGAAGATGVTGVTGATTSAPGAEADVVGPPLSLLAIALLSLLVSLALVPSDGIPLHVVGYLTGALVPILLVGLIRRVDLDRRRSAHYLASSLLQPGQALVLVGGLVAALLHVWPIATELAR